jgi:hypothetical protein
MPIFGSLAQNWTEILSKPFFPPKQQSCLVSSSATTSHPNWQSCLVSGSNNVCSGCGCLHVPKWQVTIGKHVQPFEFFENSTFSLPLPLPLPLHLQHLFKSIKGVQIISFQLCPSWFSQASWQLVFKVCVDSLWSCSARSR